jgi:hypothetical protein
MLAVSSPNQGSTQRSDSGSFFQSAPACLAVVWVKGVANESHEEKLLDVLSGANGVNQAMFSRRKPDLLMVDYDRQQTKVQDLLEKINQHSVSAKLVGC